MQEKDYQNMEPSAVKDALTEKQKELAELRRTQERAEESIKELESILETIERAQAGN